MPSIQLDLPRVCDVETKRLIAQRLGSAYAGIMQIKPDIITVVVRDLGRGGVWRCSDDEPHEAALVMCDVRAGRSLDARAELAEAVIAICAECGDLERDQIKVEFTQHPGEDMYHPQRDGFNHDWAGDETSG